MARLTAIAGEQASPFSALPSVSALIEAARAAGSTFAEPTLARAAQDALAAEREAIRSGARAGGRETIISRAVDAILALERPRLRRGINATGVIVHTNLGRAPVSDETAAAMTDAAASAVPLEIDPVTNERGGRMAEVSSLIRLLTGAEAALAVNNCAAALVLALSALAAGREVVVSRGESVEIGGGFRVPDVMRQSGATLVEVGTTNRTRIADYERAISERTGLLMKVHTSNYRVIGFTEEATPQELAALARSKGVISAFDLGSGLLEDDSMRPIAPVLGDEPLLGAALESGVDVVSFSGDKLLGAPQAGILIGRRAAISALRKNPLYRALRLDKVTLAGLEATLELILAGRGDELPVRRMLLEPAQAIQPRAQALAERIAALPCCSARVLDDHSQPGSGSAPGTWIPTFVAEVRHERLSAQALSLALRSARVPVFSRVQDDRVRLDPRTLLPGDEEDLLAAFVELTR